MGLLKKIVLNDAEKKKVHWIAEVLPYQLTYRRTDFQRTKTIAAVVCHHSVIRKITDTMVHFHM